MSPASGDSAVNLTVNIQRCHVSIQLMSPASGDKHSHAFGGLHFIRVSIQLMSPASGDIADSNALIAKATNFHSINVPSEWGPDK